MPVIPEIPNTNTPSTPVIVIASTATPPGLELELELDIATKTTGSTTTGSTTPPSLRLRRSLALDHVANLASISSSQHNGGSYNADSSCYDDDDNDGIVSAQANKKIKNKNKNKNNTKMRKSLSRIRTMIRSASSRKLVSSQSSVGGGSYSTNSNNNRQKNSKHAEYADTESSKRTISSFNTSTRSDHGHYQHHNSESEAVSTHVVKTQQPLTLLSTNRSNLFDAQERNKTRNGGGGGGGGASRSRSRSSPGRRISSSEYNDKLEPSPTFDEDYSIKNENKDGGDGGDTEDDTYIHVMINHERMARGLSPLQPSRFLTKLARAHAHVLADRTKLGHSVQTLEELQQALNSLDVGENIQRGVNGVHEMHRMSVKEGTFNCLNIIRESYLEFGMGLAKSRKDGKLYMVQLFRGRLVNSNDQDTNNRSSGGSGSGVPVVEQGQDPQQLVDATTTRDNFMDRFLLCSLCW
jgi:uncharacterized protein YkwD